MDSFGYDFMVAVFGMKTGSIPNNNMLMLRILILDFLEKDFGSIHVHTGSLQEYGFPIDRIKRTVAIAPLIGTLPTLAGTQSFERPDPSHRLGRRPITAFVGKPEPYRLLACYRQVFKDAKKSTLERLRFG